MENDYEEVGNDMPKATRNWESHCLRAEEEIGRLHEEIKELRYNNASHLMQIRLHCIEVACKTTSLDESGRTWNLTADQLVEAGEKIYKSISKPLSE